MRRAVVVGTTGAGKTAFARSLASALDVPHVELDALRHGPGWVETPDDAFRRRVGEATSAEAWVVDGNYSLARDLVWPRAQVAVWLDYPLPLVLWRLLRRTVRRVATREELWNGNRESFRNAFLSRQSLFLWALRTHGRRRRTYPAVLGAHAHLRVHRFRRPGEAERWLATVARER